MSVHQRRELARKCRNVPINFEPSLPLGIQDSDTFSFLTKVIKVVTRPESDDTEDESFKASRDQLVKHIIDYTTTVRFKVSEDERQDPRPKYAYKKINGQEVECTLRTLAKVIFGQVLALLKLVLRTNDD